MRCITLFFAFCTLSNLAFSQQEQEVRQLDSIFTMMRNQHQFNGTVLIAEKGKVILQKGYGFSNELNRSENNTKTIFELASCSKQFTAAAILLLKRQNKLQYEDKISKYLPQLDFWNKVTIADLLKHTSGIPEYLIDMPKEWDKSKIATNEDLIRFYAARRDTLQFEPHSKHRYNNTNYALLASIIEKVSGKTYAEFLATNIFKPLKMKNTFVYNRREHPQKVKNYATGYVWARNSFDKVTSENFRYGDSTVYYLDGIVGNAKVNSNVEDLYKWIVTLKNNTFFSNAEFEDMTAVTKTSLGRAVPYGFGLDVSKGENRFSFGHTGSWDGYATFIYHNMIKDRTIITLQNFKMGAYPFETITQVLEHTLPKVEYPKKMTLPETEIQKYTGTYVDEKNPEEIQYITNLDGHLIHNAKRVAWDMRFFPVSVNEFQAIRQGGIDGVLKFSMLTNGELKLEMFQYGEMIGSGIKKN